jgi:hypothetical protein
MLGVLFQRRRFYGSPRHQFTLKFMHITAAILITALVCPGASAVEPPRDELEQQWTALGANNPVRIERAMNAFVAKPEQAVAFLRKRLWPAPVADPRRLTDLLASLDSNIFSEREKAMRELESLGEVIEGDLKKVLRQRPSAEVRHRIDKLLEKTRRERLFPSEDRIRAIRAVEVLERIGNCAARRALRTLAEGASEAQLTIEAKTALERLTQNGY